MKVLLFLFAFFSSSYAVTFNCTFFVNSFTQLGNRYTCQVYSLFDLADERLTQVNGNHIAGRNHTHVQAVQFEFWNDLTFVPQGINDFFPDLRHLEFYSCSVVLNGNELNEYTRLEGFRISYSQLERIPGNLFALTPDIRYINFAYNQIRHVGQNLLDHLQHVAAAYFEYNPCISYYTTNSSIHCLVGMLRLHCPDIEDFETTTIPNDGSTTTIITTPPPECDLHGTVCYIAQQNDILIQKVSSLESELDEVKEKLNLVLQILQTLK